MVKSSIDRDLFFQLRYLGIRHFDEYIHDQSRDWLIDNFSKGATKFEINVTKLIRNIIWQTRERILSGDRPPFTELIRTFWYMYIKPTLARAGALSKESDQYDVLVQQLVYMVRDRGIMSYSDFGFRDENEANRKTGVNANVILFSEKAGFVSFLDEMNDKYSINTIALGGQPSALSVEYFVRELKNKGVDIRRSFFLFSIVDYDASGWIIRDAFINNLKAFGLKSIKNYDLINPDMLTPEEIRFAKYPIPDTKTIKKKNTVWMRQVRKCKYQNQKYLAAGKINKRRTIFGLESEAVSTKRISERLDKLVTPLLGKSERLLKIVQLEKLNKAIDNLIILKIRGGG